MSSQFSQMSITKSEAISDKVMVATKNQLATSAGLDMLQQGGNAIDAAVAACLAIGVVEPASSGIGGGGYLVYQMGDQGGVVGFPMKGPFEANQNTFQLTGNSGTGSFGWDEVLNDENIEGVKSTAIPGCVKGLYKTHKMFGKIPFKEVITPAIKLAKEGFNFDWYTLLVHGLFTSKILRYPELSRIFLPNGEVPHPAFGTANSTHTLFKQQDLADTLELISKEGSDAFYKGDIAKQIVADSADNGGILCRKDFEEYEPFVWDKGLEFNYRNHKIRVPPFGSAGITTLMTLKMLERFDLSTLGHNTTESIHKFVSCANLAYSDRFTFLGDPKFTDAPWSGLISDKYIDHRVSQIQDKAVLAKAGNPWEFTKEQNRTKLEPSIPSLDHGTTHLCVIDSEGNAVSLTNTIMSAFGSGFIPKRTGIILNNGMMWFDPRPNRVNSILPGKYPLNNMSPALILDNDGVKLSVGASGGRRITNCVTQVINNVLDFSMSPQQAIDAPRSDCSGLFVNLDSRLDHSVIQGIENKGHSIKLIDAIFDPTGMSGFASPIAITRNKNRLNAGVDTFHSAHAEGY